MQTRKKAFLRGCHFTPRLPVEERSFNTTFNPMCEVFPKVATCDYIRFGRLGGGQSNKNAICILSLNIINDKVLTQYV